MALRALLVGLIVAATGAFVIGASIERSEEPESHDESAELAPAAGDAEAHSEGARPLGIDIEAWPFVILAALASLTLALAAWLRPRLVALLALVAIAMIAFAALDVLEAFRKGDSDEAGLAILAGLVAALHLGAAVVAGLMASRERRAGVAPPRSPGTMAV